MKYLSAAETEERLFEIIIEVIKGETIIVTDNETGEPIANIVPCGNPAERLFALTDL